VQGIRERERRFEALGGILGKCAREQLTQAPEVRIGHGTDSVRRVRPDTGDTPPNKHLVDERGKAEHVGTSVPGGTRQPLWRRVGPAHRRDEPHFLECLRNTEAGDSGFVGRHQDVARVQRSVENVDRSRKVQRSTELRRNAERFADRRRTIIANDDVEGLCGHEIERQIWCSVHQPGPKWRGNPKVRQICRDEAIECGKEARDELGLKVEPELLDGDEPAWVRLVGPEDRTKDAGADLMENTEGSEGVRGRSAGSVRVQRGYSSGRWSMVTLKHFLFNRLAVLQ